MPCILTMSIIARGASRATFQVASQILSCLTSDKRIRQNRPKCTPHLHYAYAHCALPLGVGVWCFVICTRCHSTDAHCALHLWLVALCCVTVTANNCFASTTIKPPFWAEHRGHIEVTSRSHRGHIEVTSRSCK